MQQCGILLREKVCFSDNVTVFCEIQAKREKKSGVIALAEMIAKYYF